jgi:hypothetical protein
MSKDKNKKQLVFDTFVSFLSENNKVPTIADLKKTGITRDAIKHHYGNFLNLTSEARKKHPELFANIVDDYFISQRSNKHLQKIVNKYNKFVVTSVTFNNAINKSFLDSIRTYCKKNNALLILIPVVSEDPSWAIHPALANEVIAFEDLKLNNNLHISTIRLNGKQVDPVTGLKRVGHRGGSFIFASPKQRLFYVPTSNTKLPHALMTPGAITVPTYSKTSYLKERSAFLADYDHINGAIIVEIKDNEVFHFRQIQAHKDGSFVDLGTLYAKDKVSELNPEAIVLGDYHSGSTDEVAEQVSLRMINTLKPSTVVMHDFFDGASVNHHEEGKYLTKAKQALEFNNYLHDEIKGVAKDLEKYTNIKHVKNVVMVKSNHDMFLKRYLEEARYVQDSHNHYYSLGLAKATLEGHDPLKYAVMTEKPSNGHKIKWLSLDEDYKIAGIQLGAHGHLGSNGAAGSIRSMEEAYGDVIFGHTHTPQILRGAWCVGTLSKLKLSYNSGASSWMHTVCLVYKTGARQLINIIDGDYTI